MMMMVMMKESTTTTSSPALSSSTWESSEINLNHSKSTDSVLTVYVWYLKRESRFSEESFLPNFFFFFSTTDWLVMI